jgi:hypothetical protein
LKKHYTFFYFILVAGAGGCLNTPGQQENVATASFGSVFQQDAKGAPPFSDTVVSDTPADRRIFEEKWQIARKTRGALPEKALAVMQAFMGTPYGSHLLDRSSEEHLVVNLRALDCWTSVEICTATALSARDSVADYAHFCQILRQLRYRNGITNGYGSRLHYFSEWILQNANNGYLQDITAAVGGVPLRKTISFMTDNPLSYPKATDRIQVNSIRSGQDAINGHSWYYIPKTQVAQMESLIAPGDLLVLTSVIPNLDVEHQGFAVRKNGHIYLLHASSTRKRVVVSTRTLSGYLAAVPQISGLMVIRLQ